MAFFALTTSIRRWRLSHVLGLIGELSPAHAGSNQLSLWVIPIAGLILTAAHVGGRWTFWRHELATSPLRAIAGKIAGLALVQTMWALIAYAAAFWLTSKLDDSMANNGMMTSTFGTHEIILLSIMTFSLGASIWLEGRAKSTKSRNG